MTREEAIKEMIRAYDVLDFSSHMDNRRKEAFNMAKVALEQETSSDAIRRQAVLETLDDMDNALDEDRTVENYKELLKECYEVLPSVNPQEPNCKDCDYKEWLKDEIEPKTGHWIQTNESFINQDGQFIYNFICSECKSLSYFRKSNKKAIGANVCPNCGAKMIEEQERSE